MKYMLYVLICISLLGLTSCQSQKVISDSESSIYEITQIDEKYKPTFMDIESGKSAIKTLIYGSVGWDLRYRAPFLFAVQGRYILRYDIDKNEIDRIVDLRESYNGWPFQTSFSSNGRYCIEYSFDFNNDEPAHNYFIIDFERKTADLITDIYNKNFVPKLSDDIKGEMQDLRFNVNEPAVFHSYNGNEITALKDLGLGCYINVDENRIGAIMPISSELSGELGYYKFSIIDIRKNEIVHEYMLNTK